MTNFDLPPEIKEFITKDIRSVAELEVLLFLYKNSERFYGIEDLSLEMRSNESHIAYLLERLEKRNLLVSQVSDNDKKIYKFQPKDDKDRNVISLLANLYGPKKIRIMDLIYMSPIDQLKVFANAFRIRK